VVAPAPPTPPPGVVPPPQRSSPSGIPPSNKDDQLVGIAGPLVTPDSDETNVKISPAEPGNVTSLRSTLSKVT
jgi:hypothetical protein